MTNEPKLRDAIFPVLERFNLRAASRDELADAIAAAALEFMATQPCPCGQAPAVVVPTDGAT